MGYWLVTTTNNYHPYHMTLLYSLYCNYTHMLYPSWLNFSRTDRIAVKLSYILLMHFRHLYLGNLTEILDSVLYTKLFYLYFPTIYFSLYGLYIRCRC